MDLKQRRQKPQQCSKSNHRAAFEIRFGQHGLGDHGEHGAGGDASHQGDSDLMGIIKNMFLIMIRREKHISFRC